MKTAPVIKKTRASLKNVDDATRQALVRGEHASKHLMEFLSVDPIVCFDHFLQHHIPKHHLCAQQQQYWQNIQATMASSKTVSTFKKYPLLGQVAYRLLCLAEPSSHWSMLVQLPLYQALSHAHSDILRNIAAWCVVMDDEKDASFADKLARTLPFAADAHFNVREMAWLALRHHFALDVQRNIATLHSLAFYPDANIRRFVSELTRPRGVWCAHIPLLRQAPWHGLVLLEPLKNDDARYVQNSVANWLNDAAKDHPDWVLQLTDAWLQQSPSPTPAMTYIIKRARRSIKV